MKNLQLVDKIRDSEIQVEQFDRDKEIRFVTTSVNGQISLETYLKPAQVYDLIEYLQKQLQTLNP